MLNGVLGTPRRNVSRIAVQLGDGLWVGGQGGSGRLRDAQLWVQGFMTSTSKPAKSLAFRVATTKSLAFAVPAIKACPVA